MYKYKFNSSCGFATNPCHQQHNEQQDQQKRALEVTAQNLLQFDILRWVDI